MEKKITSFVPFSDKESLDHTVKSLKDSGVTANFIVAGLMLNLTLKIGSYIFEVRGFALPPQ
jgi:hypothetical protein